MKAVGSGYCHKQNHRACRVVEVIMSKLARKMERLEWESMFGKHPKPEETPAKRFQVLPGGKIKKEQQRYGSEKFIGEMAETRREKNKRRRELLERIGALRKSGGTHNAELPLGTEAAEKPAPREILEKREELGDEKKTEKLVGPAEEKLRREAEESLEKRRHFGNEVSEIRSKIIKRRRR